MSFQFRLPGLGRELCRRLRKISYKEYEKGKEHLYGTPAGDTYYPLNAYQRFHSKVNYQLCLHSLHSFGLAFSIASWPRASPHCKLSEQQHWVCWETHTSSSPAQVWGGFALVLLALASMGNLPSIDNAKVRVYVECAS